MNFENQDAHARADRVTRALNDLWRGRAVEPELKQELWLLARESPAMRCRVEAGGHRELSVPGK